MYQNLIMEPIVVETGRPVTVSALKRFTAILNSGKTMDSIKSTLSEYKNFPDASFKIGINSISIFRLFNLEYLLPFYDKFGGILIPANCQAFCYTHLPHLSLSFHSFLKPALRLCFRNIHMHKLLLVLEQRTHD